MSLVLKLAPGERVLVNGAVIENGDRRARIQVVTPDASILRLRDALHPGEVTSPVRRVCYIAQLALSGDAEAAEARAQLLHGIGQLADAMTDDESRADLHGAREAVLAGRIYQALRILRRLLPREARLLAGAEAPQAGSAPRTALPHRPLPAVPHCLGGTL